MQFINGSYKTRFSFSLLREIMIFCFCSCTTGTLNLYGQNHFYVLYRNKSFVSEIMTISVSYDN